MGDGSSGRDADLFGTDGNAYSKIYHPKRLQVCIQSVSAFYFGFVKCFKNIFVKWINIKVFFWSFL